MKLCAMFRNALPSVQGLKHTSNTCNCSINVGCLPGSGVSMIMEEKLTECNSSGEQYRLVFSLRHSAKGTFGKSSCSINVVKEGNKTIMLLLINMYRMFLLVCLHLFYSQCVL